MGARMARRAMYVQGERAEEGMMRYTPESERIWSFVSLFAKLLPFHALCADLTGGVERSMLFPRHFKCFIKSTEDFLRSISSCRLR